MRRWRNAFFTGLIVLFPLAATVWILSLLYNLISDPIAQPLRVFFNDAAPAWLLTMLGFVLALVLISMMGFLTQNFVGKRLIRFVERIFDRIPVVSSVYNATKQVVDAFTTNHNTGFRRVVLVKFPSDQQYSLGFVTREEWPNFNDVNGNPVVEGWVGVFVATTPSPANAFFVIVRKQDIIPLSVSVEDAMRMIISAGVLAPRA